MSSISRVWSRVECHGSQHRDEEILVGPLLVGPRADRRWRHQELESPVPGDRGQVPHRATGFARRADDPFDGNGDVWQWLVDLGTDEPGIRPEQLRRRPAVFRYAVGNGDRRDVERRPAAWRRQHVDRRVVERQWRPPTGRRRRRLDCPAVRIRDRVVVDRRGESLGQGNLWPRSRRRPVGRRRCGRRSSVAGDGDVDGAVKPPPRVKPRMPTATTTADTTRRRSRRSTSTRRFARRRRQAGRCD